MFALRVIKMANKRVGHEILMNNKTVNNLICCTMPAIRDFMRAQFL